MFDAHAHIGDMTGEALVCTASAAELDRASLFPCFAVGSIPGHGAFDERALREAAGKGGHIGEIGLDRRFPDKEGQEDIFRKALEVAMEYDRIAIIHVVREYGSLYDILSEMGVRRFIVHGYTGSAEMAERLLGLGGIISLSPRAEGARSFRKLLTLPFVTETDMATGAEERRILSAWNERLSELTGEDIGERSERIMREMLCQATSS